jgi:hypothetical protein
METVLTLHTPRPLLVAALVVPATCLVIHAAYSAPAKVKSKTAATTTTFERDIRPVVLKYCTACHGDAKATSGVNFQQYKTHAQVLKNRMIWEGVARELNSHAMPPKGLPQPTDAERKKIVTWVTTTFAAADCGLKNPGRVTMRRLNRAEYNNTMRDLMFVDLRPADQFPSDDVGYGFDNIGDVLSMSPLLMEKYLAAADKVVRTAVIAPEDRTGPVVRLDPRRNSITGGGQPRDRQGVLFAGNGQIEFRHNFPKDGEYSIRIKAWEQHAGTEFAKADVSLDGQKLTTLEIKAAENNAQIYPVKAQVKAGPHAIAIAFLNDYHKADDPNPKNRDRNMGIDWVEVMGPSESDPNNLPESHRKLLGPKRPNEDDKAYATRTLTDFARRAYRRPVTNDEVQRLTRYVDLAQKEGESLERGIQLGMTAALASPNFLFRVEADPQGMGRERLLNDWELASRLSYFLWSSMPDDELARLAQAGQLQKGVNLANQVKRMLRDPRSKAFAENFGGQWLTLRNLANINPDPARFPTFNENLRADMLKETELFFNSIVTEDRSILEFLDARYTFLNERLAKHYGIDGITGEEFKRVDLTTDRRGGILTQASILTLTSNPTRTSPVKRGKWVLEQILGTPPPPPPPNVPELEVDTNKKLEGTLRQQMVQHREDPLCASCHSRMDPIGFGFENYTAIGQWRDEENGVKIDPADMLASGRRFSGPQELVGLLKGNKDLFARSLVEKMLTYAMGRGVEPSDRCNLDAMAMDVAKKGYKFSALVMEVIESDPFRKRAGDSIRPPMPSRAKMSVAK